MAASLVQSSPAGEVPVEVDVNAGMARMTQLTPTFGDEFRDRDLMARACRVPVGDLLRAARASRVDRTRSAPDPVPRRRGAPPCCARA